ncbi:MAG: winged helix-turn-helix domain-containing tetratricopeptide repeat protein [Blastocatellia bacterium]
MRNGSSGLREFGKFRLDADKQVLWHDGEPVNLPLKEIEVLSVLTENAGDVITKQELMDRVWADSFVEESNLSRHIYRIRKTFSDLGESDEIIQTVPRRGYRFTADIAENGQNSIVIERHSVSRTVIEELERSEEPNIKTIPAAHFRAPYTRYALPAVLFGVIAVSFVAIFTYNSGTTASKDVKTIAVLPFKSVSGNVEDALGLGFADSLITSLGDINQVKVLSTSAVSDYARRTYEPVEEGKRLGVDFVIDGTLQHANGKIRLTIRLTRTGDGVQIWSSLFDESESDIFKLQDAMAEQTAKAMELNLNLHNREIVMKRYTANADAYQAYLKGRFLFQQSEHQRAADEFQRAIQMDPNYALAHAGLSDALARLANASAGIKRIERYEQSRDQAKWSLAIDPNLAEAHAAMGWLLRIYDWNWSESESHFRRAIELAPNEAMNYRRLAFLFVTLGRADEAIELSSKAKQLDPLDRNHAWLLYCNRRYEESGIAYASNLNSATSDATVRDSKMGIAMAYLETGRLNEALPILEELVAENSGNFAARAIYTIALFRNGNGDDVLKHLAWLEQKVSESPGRWVRLSYVYAAMGRKEQALSALEKGLETRDDRMMWIKTTPYFDEIRNEPRFQVILSKMELE